MEIINDMVNKNKHRITMFLIAALIAITFGTFLPCLTADFVNWDDPAYVTGNPWIRNISWNNIRTIFTSPFAGVYTPLVMLSYMYEYYFFQLNPLVYHATNLLIHLWNCALIFFIILTITEKRLVAFFVALLFGIHPLHVESVAWITERKDMLYGFFYLSSIVSYLCYLKNQYALRYYFVTLFLFILSLLSKPMAVSLPFVLVLIDYLLSRRFTKQSIMEKLPFLCFALLFMGIALYSAYTVTQKSFFYTFPDSIFIASYNILFYLTKMVVPTNLSAFYPYPLKINGKLPFIFYAAPFIVTFLLGSVMFFMRHKKYIIFGILFFVITIFPVLQLIPAGHTIAADRFTYIPLTGVFFLIVNGIDELYKISKRYVRVMAIVISIICCAIVAMFPYLSWQRCLVWNNLIALWNDVLRKDPYNITAYSNLGSFYYVTGDYDKAIIFYKKALTINPRFDKAYNNLCAVYLKMKRFDDALTSCQKAIELRSNYEDAFLNLGKIHHAMGKYTDAIAIYHNVHKINPKNAEAYNELCFTYLATGKYEDASSACFKAISLNPNFTDAYINLGTVAMHTEKYEDAIYYYTKATKVNPHYSLSYINLCKAYEKTKKYHEALHACHDALTLSPHSPEIYNELGNVYLAMGDYRKAMESYKESVAVEPTFGPAYNNLAVLCYSLKNYSMAHEYSRKAIENGYKIDPGFLKLLTKTKPNIE